MKTRILLSAARHPVSDRAVVSPLEGQAIGLGNHVGGEISGLHAGPDDQAIAEALGIGLSVIDRLNIAGDRDPVGSLARFLKNDKADLILAGRRGQGGLDTGLVPYLLAEALGYPIIADAIAIENGVEAGTIRVDQALKKGDRRRITLRLPAIVTVHPLAPQPAAFAFARARRGQIRTHSEPIEEAAPIAASPWSERPFRNRPKLMRTASASGGETAEKLFVEPEPREAARLIVEYLERNGIRQF